jgi:hypothetical protein
MDSFENEISVHEQYRELFLYTKISSFENIYTNKEFWATHYEDLNDSTEFERFSLRVREFIWPIIWGIFDEKILDSPENAKRVNNDGGIDHLVDNEVKMFLDTLHGHTFGARMYKDTFVKSFCAHNTQFEAKHGLLSQWRGYGADGGVAIVLDTLSVDLMLRHDYNAFDYQRMHMGDVTYDSTDNYPRIRERFKMVFDQFPKLLSEFKKNNMKKMEACLNQMHDHFVFGSTFVKHHAFHEENEIRIVVSPTTKDSFKKPQKQQKEIHTHKGDREFRYINLCEKGPLPTIKRIIVGPSITQDQNCEKIKELVKSSITVDKSEIPLVR